MQTWEQIALGAIILLVLLMGFPRIKASMAASADEPKNWGAVLLPIGMVVLFVLLLIQLA